MRVSDTVWIKQIIVNTDVHGKRMGFSCSKVFDDSGTANLFFAV